MEEGDSESKVISKPHFIFSILGKLKKGRMAWQRKTQENTEKRRIGSYDIEEICKFQKITNDNKNYTN
jgi:hypothetical protein